MALVLKPCFDNIEPVGEASQNVPAHVEIRRSRRQLSSERAAAAAAAR